MRLLSILLVVTLMPKVTPTLLSKGEHDDYFRAPGLFCVTMILLGASEIPS